MGIPLVIFAFICTFLSQEVLSNYSNYETLLRTPQKQAYNSESSYGHPYNYHHYTIDKQSPPVGSKTEYGFHTVQTGTSYIPQGQTNAQAVLPEEKQSQYYFVTTNTTTFYVPNAAEQRSYNNRTRTNPSRTAQHRQTHRYRPLSNCIKCPPEKVMIARKGLDGVFVEPPKLMSCQNRLIINDAYQIETLFGPSFKFLLSHGSHSFHARIKNRHSGKHLQTCILRYKVVVQQCGRFFPQDVNLRATCDPGYIWGAKCSFTCRVGYLSHDRPMVCGDSLQWEGDEPECLPQSSQRGRSCDFLTIPDHGRFSCEYPRRADSETYENDLTTPEGTVCHVICDRYYEIPPHLEPYSVLRCQNGRWNATATDLCRANYRHRY